MTDTTKLTRAGVSRRYVLKAAAGAAGVAIGSGAIRGFPTIWAQNLKDIKLLHVGQSYSAIKEIGIQATKDLGFTIEIQVVDANTQLNRLFTQPKTIDINDMESFDMIRLQGKKVLAPIPTAKYKLYDKIVPIFTKGDYPDGRKVSTQGVSPFSVQYWADKDGTKLAKQATDWMTGIPMVYNADTLGIRPDLIGRKVTEWKELLNPEFKGKAALVDAPSIGIMDVAMALEVPWRPEIRRQGQHDQRRDRQDHRDHDRIQEVRSFPRVLDQFRPVGEPDGLRRGGDPVDVVARRHRRAQPRHRLLLCAAQGRLPRLVEPAVADGASDRAEGRLRDGIPQLVQFRLAGRLHRQARLLQRGSGDGEEVHDRRMSGTTGTKASQPRSTSWTRTVI